MHNNPYQLKPISTPLIFSGINSNILNTITPTFEKMGFLISTGGTSKLNSNDNSSTLLPGDAVACVIISGDYNMAATGTVTYSDGKNVLAFGHPYFNSGPVNMPMAKAKIMTILSSLMQSRKFASTGKIIGAIRQDRPSGIMGVIGEEAPMIPIEVVYNSPFNEKLCYNYNLAKDKTLSSISPVFLWITLLSTLESARFSNGTYSIQLAGKIVLKNHSDIILDNYYAGSNFGDPAGAGQDIMHVAYDIVMKLMPLLNNQYEFPDIQKIQLHFKALPGKRSLKIENVWYDKTNIKPGEKLNITIKLKEFQDNVINISKTLTIPSNITSKRIILAVGSANYMTAWDRRYTPSKFNPKNFDQLTYLLNNLKRNNILYIQIKALDNGAIISGKELPNLPPTILNIIKERKTSGSSNNLREAIIIEKQIHMEYGIHGGKSLNIKVTN